MPKSKRISNLLKLAHVASSDPIHAPLGSPDVMSATPTLVVDNVSSQLSNQMRPAQQGVESSRHRTNVPSQLPNQTSSQPAQQGVRRSHRVTNASSQLPNQTLSQPGVRGSPCKVDVSSQLPCQTSSQPGVRRSRRRANVSSQLPSQTPSQLAQKEAECSHCRVNASSPLPNQTSSQPGVRRSHRIANISSQLPNQTSSQPAQQGVGSSHHRANASSQLPSQTPSQLAQKEAERSLCRVNVSAQVPCQTSPQPAQQEVIHPERRDGRVSTHYWFVDAIDEEHGTIKKLRLNSKDVKDMPNTLCIIVDFDEFHSPIGEAAGLLAGVCGLIATNSVFFPIGYDKWSNMPGSYFDEQWVTFFLPRFCFKVHEDLAKRYIEASIGKKWREYRNKLWKAYYHPTLSKSKIINKRPKEIPPNHWELFVEYRLKPETMELCKRNQEIRKNQAYSHTCGAKSLARRRHELSIETGKTIGRGLMWKMIHKKKDGSYVNDKAMEIGEKIDSHINQNHEASSETSPNDVVANIFGREHPGRVRTMGLGVVPTIAFKHTTTRFCGMEFGSSSGGNSSVEQKLAAVTAQLKAVVGYISAKEGGTLPKDLAALFPNQIEQIPDIGSEFSDLRTLSDGSNIHQNPSNST